MASKELQLQGAIVARLKGFAGLSALVADRVFDAVPDKAKYPYVTLGETQFLNTDMSCIRAWDAYLTLHSWSQKVGFTEVKQIADAIEDALHLAPLPMQNFRVALITHSQSRAFRDPDGVTSHAVNQFIARVEAIPA
ncbi:DUF3168 domain-containing protein [Rhizobium sp. BK491]|uniref:DUF3168 domain-containing protein n=1 Tax=Rhizobium sp. BK491 TaxID=2587009 RepID=UPI00161B4D25|nr:DUF3168 domain-containing protein [Rhizobium sp. BK491]MBB3567224.1 hypothetical protein [Rhizobium sp. BK491]